MSVFYKHPCLSDAGIGLVNHIIGRLDEAGIAADPGRIPRVLDLQGPALSPGAPLVKLTQRASVHSGGK